MKKLFLNEAEANKVFPIGAGLWTRLHPEDRIKVPYTHWTFDATTTRLPEFAAPGLGRESNRVVVDVELGEDASGVLYALGGVAGGLSLYMDKGHLVYEYNMMMIERYIGRSPATAARRQAPHRRRHDDRASRADRPTSRSPSTMRSHARRGRRAPCPAPSRPARRSTSASISARRSRSTISTGAPFAFNGQIEKVDVTLR